MKRLFCGCISVALLLTQPVISWAEEASHLSDVSYHIEIVEQDPLLFPQAAPEPSVHLTEEDDALPEIYDPRENGTPLNPIQYWIRTDDLWAYQATSALELSNYKTFGQMQKFSEQHMLASLTFDNQNPFTAARTSGGNRIFSTAYVTRGSGPVLQSEFNYNAYQNFLNSNQNTDTSSPENNHYDASLLDISDESQNYMSIEYLTAAGEGTYSHRFADTESEGLNTNYEKIKQAVYQYGAVVTDYYMYETDESGRTTEYYNPETGAYNYRSNNYNDQGEACDSDGDPIVANGTITIVGWDDTYPINNFNNYNLPPQNGAWIVRTDRGTSWADGGYEYISYYDHMFGRNASVYKPETETYNNIYQYDPLLNLNCSTLNRPDFATTSLSIGSKVLWIGNRYEKNSSLPEKIDAIGFYVQSYDYIAELYIDPSPDGDSPSTDYGSDLLPVALENGDLGLPTQITFSSPGYYILKLREPITITSAFDVVLRLENVQTSGDDQNRLVLGFAAGNALNGTLTMGNHSFYAVNPSNGFTTLDTATAFIAASSNWNIKVYTEKENPSFTAEKTTSGITLTLRDSETEAYENSNLIVAFYDRKNYLLDTKIINTPDFVQAPNDLPTWQLEILQSEIPDGTSHCKAFIWNNFEDIAPVTDMIAELDF